MCNASTTRFDRRDAGDAGLGRRLCTKLSTVAVEKIFSFFSYGGYGGRRPWTQGEEDRPGRRSARGHAQGSVDRHQLIAMAAQRFGDEGMQALAGGAVDELQDLPAHSRLPEVQEVQRHLALGLVA